MIRKSIICIAAALLLAATGCASKNDDVIVQPVETPEAEQTQAPEATAEQDDYAEKAAAAYIEAVKKLVNDNVYPDGTETGFVEDDLYGYGDMSENKYAIADVDADGRDELIISFVTAPMAGELEMVCSYDEATGSLKTELAAFPAVTYYTKGIAKAEDSHNQGWAGDRLWPYALYCYNTKTGEYELTYSIDAWDKNLASEDYEGNPYPADIDKDGDGYVVEMIQNGESKYISVADYEAWLKDTLGDVEELKIDFKPVTEVTGQ